MRVSSNVLLLVLLLLILLFVGVLISYVMLKKKHQREAEDSIFLTSKHTLRFDKWYNLYTTFSSIGITRNYLEGLKIQFEILDPDNEKLVKEKAVKTALLIWSVSFVTLLTVIVMKPTWYMLLCAAWFVYFISSSITSTILSKSEAKLLAEFTKFISEVRYRFFQHGMVEEAIYETFDKLSKTMQGHAIKMYNTLTSDNLEEALFKYNKTVPNNFMKQFVSICAITMKYGDKKVKGQSLFLMDIKDLKESLDNHILHRVYVNSKFNGFGFVASVPVFAMNAMKNWGVSTTPQLQKFYNGSTGQIIVTFSFIITFLVYWIVLWLKNTHRVDRSEHPILNNLSNVRIVKKFIFNFEEANFTKTYKMRVLLKRIGSSLNTQTFLLYRIGYGIAGGLATLIFIIGLNFNQVSMALNDVASVATTASGVSEEVAVAMVGMTKYYIDQYKDVDLLRDYNTKYGANEKSINDKVKQAIEEEWAAQFQSTPLNVDDDFIISIIQKYNYVYSAESKLYTVYYGFEGDTPVIPDDIIIKSSVERDFSKIKNCMMQEGKLGLDHNYAIVAKEVLNHVLDYQNASFKWWYVLVAMLVAALMYNMPVLVYKLSEHELQDFMEDEVVQFQSVIMILMYIEQMTVQSILEEIVKFAFCFEDSIQKCINNLSAGEQEALQQLYDDEPFEAFQRLVENLMSVDKIGVKEAFNEIDIERKNYLEKRKQENELKLNNRVAVCNILAFVPVGFIIVAYLVYPFMVQATVSLTEQMSSI